MHNGLDQNNNSNTEVFKILKIYNKIVKNQKDRKVNQNSDNFFPTKSFNTTIPNQNIYTVTLSNTNNERMNRFKKHKYFITLTS